MLTPARFPRHAPTHPCKRKPGAKCGLAALGLLALAFALAGPSPGVSAGEKKPARPARPAGAAPAGRAATGGSRWVRIVYDDLIDRSVVTRSGDNVGILLAKAFRGGAGLPKTALADLQPHLEPFSFICNDIAAAGAPGGKPYASVADDYPPGSRQPAWVALFREGQYQLFLGDGRARLFLKGENPAALLGRYHGVVRHPLLKALEKSGTDRIVVEVYAFRNDYRTRALHLDLTPYVTELSASDCAPKRRELSLEGLSDFFAPGPVLEAAEIDDNNDFFLYGGGAGQTVAGRPEALEDFAVVYRAVFHHGRNPPYVSLDRDEDDRFAKVNFGGLLEDTRVGSVLLEADKRFKTMISGIDPDTRAPAVDRIKAAVPEFRTVDERGLLRDDPATGSARFWFYPDKIRTVTDGRLGVVSSSLFTADEERLDGRPRRHWAGREAVDDLNRNFENYAKVYPSYRELQTVGRMMAIAKWLEGSDARRRTDLDALLSVELSPHRTPGRVRRILAATEVIRLAHGASVKEYRYVSCLDDVLELGHGTANDSKLVELARQEVRRKDVETLLPRGMFGYFASGTRLTASSISGGVNLDPAAIASPLKSPGSPLIVRLRGARPAVNGAPAVRPEGMTRSPLRRPPPSPAKPAKPPRTEEKKRGAPATGPAGTRPAGGSEPRPHRAQVVVTTPSYPAEIIVTGDASAGGTIVLKRGRARGPQPGVPPAN